MYAQNAYMHLVVTLMAYAELSRGFSGALFELLSFGGFSKGRVMVECGKRQDVVWFLHRGTAKEVSPCEDSALGRTSWFFTPSDFLFAHPGFFAREPAIASIELIEDCYLAEISYSDFMVLRGEFAEVEVLVERIRAKHEKARAEHLGDLVNLSAKERYHKFYAAHKGLFNVAKHKDIASFLGIKDDGFHRYQ